MAVFSKRANFSFNISEKKLNDFKKTDTRPAFTQAIEKFKKHGGKTDSTK
jgi:hypothetical protein